MDNKVNKNRNKINNLRRKVSLKREKNLIDVWHFLMMAYGWIPFEDFKNLEAGLVDELIVRVNEDGEQIRSKSKMGRGL